MIDDYNSPLGHKDIKRTHIIGKKTSKHIFLIAGMMLIFPVLWAASLPNKLPVQPTNPHIYAGIHDKSRVIYRAKEFIKSNEGCTIITIDNKIKKIHNCGNIGDSVKHIAYWDHSRYSIGYGTISYKGEKITTREADSRLNEHIIKEVIPYSNKIKFKSSNQEVAFIDVVFWKGYKIVSKITTNGELDCKKIERIKINNNNLKKGLKNRSYKASIVCKQ